jgi:hypothetical protein
MASIPYQQLLVGSHRKNCVPQPRGKDLEEKLQAIFLDKSDPK